VSTRVDVNNEVLTWAIDRAGYDLPTFFEKYPPIIKWLEGEKRPTVKQLEEFSKKVHVPFGYLFLPLNLQRKNFQFRFLEVMEIKLKR